MEKKMEEKVTKKEPEVQAEPEPGTEKVNLKGGFKELIKIQEIRMVIYVIPVAILIWIFSYFWQHYVQTHFLNLFH
jgi:hypothetical protein